MDLITIPYHLHAGQTIGTDVLEVKLNVIAIEVNQIFPIQIQLYGKRLFKTAELIRQKISKW